MRFLLLLTLSLIIFSCEKKDQNIKFEYYSTGAIKSIKRFKNGKLNGESTWYYLSGVIKEKVQCKDGTNDGFAYYFYPSGCIENYRYFQNGNEINVGFDYYDHPMMVIKSILHFNESGKIYYKQNFDDHGRPTTEEGKKPI